MAFSITFRPVRRWPRRCAQDRRAVKGTSYYDKSRAELVKHLTALEAAWAYVGVNATEKRDDGWPSASDKPDFPGVLLLIDSKYGLLLLACDKFATWPHNFRAIVQVLENLRRIAASDVLSPEQVYSRLDEGIDDMMMNDSLGHAFSGVHINPRSTGKGTKRPTAQKKAPSRPKAQARTKTKAKPKAPPTAPPPPPRSKPAPKESETFASRSEAANWLSAQTGFSAQQIMSSEAVFLLAWRKAARELHPDKGGDAAQFRRAHNAKSRLEQSAPWTK